MLLSLMSLVMLMLVPLWSGMLHCCFVNVWLCVHWFSAQSGVSIEKEREKVTHVTKDIVSSNEHCHSHTQTLYG